MQSSQNLLEKLEAYKDSSDREDRQTFLFMERAYNFAKQNRALGMGVLGWHSLLQSKMLAFNSQEAYNLNSEIFKFIKEKSYKASEDLAVLNMASQKFLKVMADEMLP
jgi:ribonucleoside-diphosphate reductase alpha chain